MDSALNSLLKDVVVVEYSHMVMGPCCGVILADLGARVIKVEPLKGDNTRRLGGSGAGYFPMFNRNKESITIDVNQPRGLALLKKLIDKADVFIENFRKGSLDKHGLDYPSLQEHHQRLIYLSLKGFLSGPYQDRTALDEVAQMFSGLAYMTGLPDRPMRAGTSVVDITGAMFGVIGILAMLQKRAETGRGGVVVSSLFETAAFLVGQHIAQFAVSGKPLQPMSVRQSAWSIYDIFKLNDGSSLFVAVVSDTQWRLFCKELGFDEWLADPQYAENNNRVALRDVIIPGVQAKFLSLEKSALLEKVERIGVSFAPINRPNDLLQDQQMRAQGLLDVALSDGPRAGDTIPLPATPLEIQGKRLGLTKQVPHIGEDSSSVCSWLGLSREDILQYKSEGIIGGP